MDDEEDRPLIIAWLSNPSDQSNDAGADGVYNQLSEEIFEPNEERSKVITLHLYVEFWLDRIFETISLPPPDHFWKKIDTLNKRGTFTKALYENLMVINKLRNIYAHQLDLAKANSEVSDLISKMTLDPYFVCTDRDHFRLICIQTMFLLETTFNNKGQPPEMIHPAEAIREELKRKGKLHWQKCELISKNQVSRYVHRTVLKCPLCSCGTITREKDDTPGFRESDMTRCKNCGLTGDGSYLIYESAKG